jgi:biotin synthase
MAETATILSQPTLPSQTVFSQLLHTYHQPFLTLMFQAQQVHQAYHPANTLQLCTLSNIKSGKCPEDCSYCPQSAHYNTGVDTWDLPPLEEIEKQVDAAKANGSSRFCMGAAWRNPPNEKAFQQVLDMVKLVRAAKMEACVTLGMLTAEQAMALKEAGLTAYNHNIDTSPNYYPEIISTRCFEDRLQTLQHVSRAGIQVCCGGILGMGETVKHRLEMLQVLCELETPPESVPVNCLVPVEGTPLADTQPEPVNPIELARFIATIRIYLPKAKIRLSAGRTEMSDEAQTLCFLAGANAIFTGDVLLTTPNPGEDRDHQLMQQLGLTASRE